MYLLFYMDMELGVQPILFSRRLATLLLTFNLNAEK